MFRCRFILGLTVTASASLVVALAIVSTGANSALAQPPENSPTQVIFGDSRLVQGNLVVAWARLHNRHGVQEVGITIPVEVLDDMPEEGDGPDGAFASLAFPDVVQETTYFNHVELHSNPLGHDTPPGSVNPIRNSVPHFDFHFYAIDEADVWMIPASVLPPPRLPRVPANLLPVGYTQPGPSLAEMGRHSGPVWGLLDPNFLSTVMIAGFLPDATRMHFIEPMVSRDRLLERTDFELPVPMPAEFGRTMRYPTKFTAEYDADSDAYHFVFSEFIGVE